MGLVDDLKAVGDQLAKAKGEIVGKLDSLESALANAGTDSAEVTAAVAALKDAAQGLDDVVADAIAPAPVEDAPVVEETAAE